ncbi:exodeoxyribonuclease VII small subunit [Terriglobus sp. RCC_193]|uniref:exodeoxyribonuclease VII small subunit n=1 Tax=Terriglobus sp. RCC_193 TaxID=3239218 RepID=UPI003524FBB0
MATFEEQLKSLESVVERLEKGDLSLEESLALFEQGVALSESCKKELDAAEGRVQVLLQRGRKMEAEDLALSEDE